jgi:hypothetical protein
MTVSVVDVAPDCTGTWASGSRPATGGDDATVVTAVAAIMTIAAAFATSVFATVTGAAAGR